MTLLLGHLTIRFLNPNLPGTTSGLMRKLTQLVMTNMKLKNKNKKNTGKRSPQPSSPWEINLENRDLLESDHNSRKEARRRTFSTLSTGREFFKSYCQISCPFRIFKNSKLLSPGQNIFLIGHSALIKTSTP